MQDLVVIGNGMAGARAVEEILARRGGQQFQITVVGDEPYGNYNRIMLSRVLAGDDADEIYLNPLDWYAENDITLHAGVRVVRIDRFARKVFGDDGAVLPYDKLVIATGSRTFFPPMDGMWVDDCTLTPGVFGFRTLDDTTAMIEYAGRHHRAVVIGGGLLGLEAAYGLREHGLEVQVVQSEPVLLNQQLDEEAGPSCARSSSGWGSACTPGSGPPRCAAPARSPASSSPTGARSTRTWWWSPRASGPTSASAWCPGSPWSGGSSWTTRCAASTSRTSTSSGSARSTAGRCTGWSRRCGSRPPCSPTTSPAPTRRRPTTVRASRRSSRSPASTSRRWGSSAPSARTTSSSGSPSPSGASTSRSSSATGSGATLLGDVSKVAFLTQSFDRGLPLPEARVELLFELGGPSETEGAAEMDGSVQVCNCNGVSKDDLVGCVRAGTRSVDAVMAATRAGKGCGSCKSLVREIVEWAAGDGVEVAESAGWYVPSIPLDKPALVAAVRERGLRSVSAVFAELAPDGEDAGSKMALASLLKMLWGPDYVDERDARFINDRVHANIQRDGTFSVVPRITGGVTTAAQLRSIADVADKYAIPMLKITGGQRIDLLGVRKQDLPAVWADLDMPSGYAYGKSFRTVKTCVGTDFCRYGLGDSTQLGIDIEERYKGLESPAKLKLAVAGCPRNCSEALVKDVGLVAVGEGNWEVYVGGAAGASVRKGDLLTTVDSHPEAIRLTGVFLQYYRENARWLERTYDFVPRVGLEELTAVLVDDRDGIVAGLEERMQACVDAYRDPWLEGREPTTAGQFHGALPLIPLPQVPVRDGSSSPKGVPA